jgi:hypothetical protein
MAVQRLDLGGVGAVGVHRSVSMIGQSSGRDLSKDCGETAEKLGRPLSLSAIAVTVRRNDAKLDNQDGLSAFTASRTLAKKVLSMLTKFR